MDPQQSPDYGRIINRKATEHLARLLDSGTAVGGRRFRAVKVALKPRSPECSRRGLGWVIEVKPLAGPFLPGLGGRVG